MIYAYCRVSSKVQMEGNGLEAQEKEILSRYSNAIVYKEQHTGKTVNRPIFEKVLSKLKTGDTLVVAKLDRLARNTTEGITIIQDLFKRGVAVHVLNVGLLEDTATGHFFITTLLAVAELERQMILERTAAGREIARKREGYKEGRPKKYNHDRIISALKLTNVHGGNLSFKQAAELTGISIATLQRESKQHRETTK